MDKARSSSVIHSGDSSSSEGSSSSKELSVNAFFGGTFDPPHWGHLLPLMEIADITGLSAISLLPANVPVFKKEITAAKHRIAMTRLLCEQDKRLKVDLTEFSRTSISYTIDTLIHIKQQQPEQAIVFIIGLDSLLSLHLWERWQQLFDYCHIVVMQRSILSSGSGSEPNTGLRSEIEQLPISDTEKAPVILPTSANVAPKLYNFYTSEQEFDQIAGPETDEQARLFLLSKLAVAQSDSQCINQDAFQDIIQTSAMGNLWFIKNQILPLSSTDIRQHVKAGKNISHLVPTSIIDYINVHQLYIT